jgi:hypothetical protein
VVHFRGAGFWHQKDEMAGNPPIVPILIADKATVALSAEEGGKIKCV